MSGRLVAAIDDDAAVRREAVHLDEQLVERLLALLVAQRVAAPRAADRVELVDEDDAARVARRVLEEPPHARRADAGVHLDEVRAAREQERHARLAGNRPRQQRLAGAGRPDQQHPFGMRPPSGVNRSGSRRKSTISLTSSFASSTPATSAKVMTVSSRGRDVRLALERRHAAGGDAVEGEGDEAERIAMPISSEP